MKITTIVGARPQFVKAGIVSVNLKKYPSLKEVIIHTGQHFDNNMSDIFFKEMEIPKPKYNLNINNVSHGAMTGRMLESLEVILMKEKPDFCMVYGDTNSTLAGALAAKKINIPVIHVEAGLRSHNMKMPEEINRILTDRISDILFCPTQSAVNNLNMEGFEQFNNTVHLSGDVMEDAAIYYSRKTEQIKKSLNLPNSPYILATIHRAENTDNPGKLQNLIEALNRVSELRLVILPLHPRTKSILESSRISLNFNPIEPVGYLQMLKLIKNASLVLTDSGGVQKEAYFFRKYCLTLREETEWTELVENRYNHLVGTNIKLITSLTDKYFSMEINNPKNLYGNGCAADYICKSLSKI